MDKSENRYVLWSDGDSRGYTSEEWQENMQFRVNEITANKVTLNEVVSQQWNVKDPTDLLRLLTLLVPGEWNIRHTTKLTNTMLGGKHFNPLLIVTDDSETSALLSYLRMDHLAKKVGLDPCAGKRNIARVFRQKCKQKLFTNDINSLFPAHYHYDALDPASYATNKLGRFDFIVTSIPFAFADILIPLFELAYEASFLHIPSWYAFQGSPFRKQWLTQLIQERRVIVLNINDKRNSGFGKFAVWLCIFRSKEIASNYLRDSNRLFTNSLPCFFG